MKIKYKLCSNNGSSTIILYGTYYIHVCNYFMKHMHVKYTPGPQYIDVQYSVQINDHFDHLQSFLCSFQCSLWHSFPQYEALWHLEQDFREAVCF